MSKKGQLRLILMNGALIIIENTEIDLIIIMSEPQKVYVIKLLPHLNQLKKFEAFTKWSFNGCNFMFQEDEDGENVISKHLDYNLLDYRKDLSICLENLENIRGLQRRDWVILGSCQYKVFMELTQKEKYSDEELPKSENVYY
jgi:hypothetical protein